MIRVLGEYVYKEKEACERVVIADEFRIHSYFDEVVKGARLKGNGSTHRSLTIGSMLHSKTYIARVHKSARLG